MCYWFVIVNKMQDIESRLQENVIIKIRLFLAMIVELLRQIDSEGSNISSTVFSVYF